MKEAVSTSIAFEPIVERKKSKFVQTLINQRYLYLMLLPGFIVTLVFSYGPMYGLYMAFINYQPGGPFLSTFFHSQFVGLQWFQYFFQTGDFYTVMRNTIGISLLTIIITFPAPIIIAIALSEIGGKYFKKIVQTGSYLPHFISWVIAANIVLTLLSANGVVNQALLALHITKHPIIFFQIGPLFWWIIAFSNLWKGMGYSSIMYLAGIASINPALYEAAKVDGASKLRQIWHITLPGLRPTIIVLLILSVGGILNAGFDQEFLMQNSLVMNYSNVIDTYSYIYGLQNSQFSFGAAVGMFKSVVSLILLLIVNRIAKKVSDHSVF